MGGSTALSGTETHVGLIARVGTNGELDDSFGNEGHIIIDLPSDREMIHEIISLENGNILIAGDAYFGANNYFPDSTAYFVGRLLPDGQVDTTFGNNGFVFHWPSTLGYCNCVMLGDMAVKEDGKILLVGNSYSPVPTELGFQDDGCTNNIFLFQYLSNGMPDLSFGQNGQVELILPAGEARDLTIEEDGKILISGADTGELPFSWLERTLLWRLLPDGQPDNDFGEQGKVSMRIFGGPAGVCLPVNTIKINTNYYAGWTLFPTELAFGIMRFTDYGGLDSTFVQSEFGDPFNLTFTTWDNNWLPFGGIITDSYIIDSTDVYFVGNYTLASYEHNMMIAKIKLPPAPPISSTDIPMRPLVLKAYPNPVSSGKLYLKGEGEHSQFPLSIRVVDIEGQLVHSEKNINISDSFEIDVSGFPGGIYFIEVTGNYSRWVEKIVIP